ncbi:hypothetical protein HDU83_003008 [Entophlyctis luteolus]|nr:hypothetical protein HDU83_003008 [Entophlyctis luteolus]
MDPNESDHTFSETTPTESKNEDAQPVKQLGGMGLKLKLKMAKLAKEKESESQQQPNQMDATSSSPNDTPAAAPIQTSSAQIATANDLSIEARAHELEQEMRRMRQMLAEAQTAKAASQDALSIMTLKLAEETKTSNNIRDELRECRNERDSYKIEISELQLRIAETVDRQTELDRVNSEVAQLREELERAQSELKNSLQISHMSQSEEAKYRILSLEFEKEKKDLKANIDWLNSEMESKSKELATFREEKAAVEVILKKEAETSRFENSALESKNVSLIEKSNSDNLRIEELSKKLAESELHFNSLEESFKSEMNVQQSLVNLYKSKSEENLSQIDELRASVHITQQQCAQYAREQLNFEDKMNVLKREIALKDETIESLESKIAALNQQVSSNLSILHPASQEAMSHQKKGKTFTEIYAEYSELKEENLRLKSETFRLQDNLESIIADVNEKAPVIKQAMIDKRNLTKEVSELTTKLELLEKSCQSLQDTIASLKSQVDSVSLERQAALDESTSLRKQVHHLLLRLESLRPLGASQQVEPDTPPGLFSSIEGLESENAKLRAELREAALSISKLETEKESLNGSRATTADVESLQSSVSRLKENLRISELKAGSFKRERDQIKWLLDNRSVVGHENHATGTQEKTENRPNEPDYEKLLQQLQIEYDQFREETGFDTATLKSNYETMIRTKNDLEIQNAKLNCDISNLQGKQRQLMHAEFQRKEKTELHSRISSLMSGQSQQEIRFQEVTNQLVEMRQQLESSKNDLRHIRSERDICAENEVRLQAECAELAAQRNLATEHLKRMQTMFEGSEARIRTTEEKNKEALKAQESIISNLKAEIVAARNDAEEKKLELQTEIQEMRFKIDRLETQAKESAAEISSLKESEQKLTKTLEHTKHLLEASEESLARFTIRNDSTESQEESTVQALQADLHSTKFANSCQCIVDISLLRVKLEHAQTLIETQHEHIEQYRAIAKAAEEKLLEKVAEFEVTFNSHREESNKTIADLQVKLYDFAKFSDYAIQKANRTLSELRLDSESKLSQALEELTEQRTQIDKDQMEFLMERSRLEDEIARVRSTESQTRSKFQSLQNALRRCKEQLHESETDYEKIILLESERIKNIEVLRTDLSKANASNVTLQDKIAEIQKEYSTEKSMLAMQVSESNKKIQTLTETKLDLEVQITSLNDHIAVLNATINRSRENGSAPPGDVSVNDIGQSNVVRHLTREKEILEKENTLAGQKLNRMQDQLERLYKALEETRTALNQERLRNQSNSDSARLHSELMSKVDNVNVLTEANHTLRSQNSELAKKNDLLEKRIRDIEADIQPMRDANSGLQSDLEMQKIRIVALEEENARLVDRANQILGKYSRVDPFEHQALKEQVAVLSAKLESARSEFEAEKSAVLAAAKASDVRLAEITTELASAASQVNLLKADNALLKLNEAGKAVEESLRAQVEDWKAKHSKTVFDANTKMKNMFEKNKDKVRGLEARVKELEDALAAQATATTAPELIEVATTDLKEFSATGSTDAPIDSGTVQQSTKAAEAPAVIVLSSSTVVEPMANDDVTSPKRPRDDSDGASSEEQPNLTPEMQESAAKRKKLDAEDGEIVERSKAPAPEQDDPEKVPQNLVAPPNSGSDSVKAPAVQEIKTSESSDAPMDVDKAEPATVVPTNTIEQSSTQTQDSVTLSKTQIVSNTDINGNINETTVNSSENPNAEPNPIQSRSNMENLQTQMSEPTSGLETIPLKPAVVKIQRSAANPGNLTNPSEGAYKPAVSANPLPQIPSVPAGESPVKLNTLELLKSKLRQTVKKIPDIPDAPPQSSSDTLSTPPAKTFTRIGLYQFHIIWDPDSASSEFPRAETAALGSTGLPQKPQPSNAVASPSQTTGTAGVDTTRGQTPTQRILARQGVNVSTSETTPHQQQLQQAQGQPQRPMVSIRGGGQGQMQRGQANSGRGRMRGLGRGQGQGAAGQK